MDELKKKAYEIEEENCDDNCQFERKFRSHEIEDETYKEPVEEVDHSNKNPDIVAVWDPEHKNNPDTDYFSVLAEDDSNDGEGKKKLR